MTLFGIVVDLGRDLGFDPNRKVSIADGIRDDFAGANMVFNHFTKALEQELVHRVYLLRHFARNAAQLCTNNDAIDALVPFLVGRKIHRMRPSPVLKRRQFLSRVGMEYVRQDGAVRTGNMLSG